MVTNDSSGRWDATGSFEDAVNERRELSRNWANSLPLTTLHHCITTMASDSEAFTLYERKALLEVVALILGRELNEIKKDGQNS